MFFRKISSFGITCLILFLQWNKAASDDHIITREIAEVYLSKYGYLNNRNTEDDFVDSVKIFQNYHKLEATGILDTSTKNQMVKPRCKLPDVKQSRFRRFVLEGSSYNTTHLTYAILTYPSTLSAEETNEEIRRAFNMWAAVSRLSFKQVVFQNADITIKFIPFKDPIRVDIAQAFFPKYGGEIHFDDTQDWSQYSTLSLFQTATHEIGHVLGLCHTDFRDSIMYPIYGFKKTFKLSRDDISAIQSVYGPPKESMTPHVYLESSDLSSPNLCSFSEFDTIFSSGLGEIVVFKGEHYWMLNDSGILPDYPKKISEKWKGLPGDIDAAMSYRGEFTIFFKESQLWLYTLDCQLFGEPKLIQTAIPGIPQDVTIEGLTVLSGTENIILFSKSRYWEFNLTSSVTIGPKSISENWSGVPDGIDGVLQLWSGTVFFFKRDQYWAYNQDTEAVDIIPPYPRSVRKDWFKCPKPKFVEEQPIKKPVESITSTLKKKILRWFTNENIGLGANFGYELY